MAAPREDPGWRTAVYAQLFPIGSRKNQRALDGLTISRVIFVALMQAAAACGLILVIVTQDLGAPKAGTLALVLALGLAGVGAAAFFRNRRLDATDAQRLASSYRKHFFVGFVANELALLVAVVIGLTRRELWPYFLELPFFIAGMAIAGPTRKNIERAQGSLEGSKLSLRDALMAPPESKSS